MLMMLFQLFCFNCKSSSPSVEVRRTGSMATVIQSCKQCKKEYRWRSQPLLFGKVPAGNLMMSLAILTSGVNISQVFLMFKHLGLLAISVRTFFQHQRKFLFPSVLLQWEKHRSSLIVSGSGRHLGGMVWSQSSLFRNKKPFLLQQWGNVI